MIIFHGKAFPMPMPTSTDEERCAFADQVASELPAFVHWLTSEWEIPAELLTYPNGKDATRFGFREWHHPIVKGAFYEDSPGSELITLIDAARFTGKELDEPVPLFDLPSRSTAPGMVWWERAITLQQLLTGEGEYHCSVAKLACKFFQHNNIGRTLHRLEEDEKTLNQRVTKGDTREWKGWKIAARVI